MERLTVSDLNNVCYDPWELCGMDDSCTKGSNDEGGCYEGCNIQKMYRKLAKYEDLEEQGLIPPCKVGDPVYFIPSKVNYSLNILNGYKENNRVYNQKVAKIVFTERGWHLECDKDMEYGTDHVLVDKFYKETWFFSQAEAEEALKRMEGAE